MSADNKLTLADLRRSISRCPPKKERKSSHLRHSLNCVEYFEFSSSTTNRIKTFSRNMGTSSTHQNTKKKNTNQEKFLTKKKKKTKTKKTKKS